MFRGQKSLIFIKAHTTSKVFIFLLTGNYYENQIFNYNFNCINQEFILGRKMMIIKKVVVWIKDIYSTVPVCTGA